MSELINKILKTEEKAKKIMEDAKEKCKEIEKSMIAETEKIKEISKENMEKEIRAIEEKEKEIFLIKERKMEEEKDFEIGKLKNRFLENYKNWVEEIVFNVIRQ